MTGCAGGGVCVHPRGGWQLIDTHEIADAPPARLIRKNKANVRASVRHLSASRAQAWALTRRDFTARYKQTFLGFGWALVLPLLTILVFGVFVQRYAHANTHGVPYILWSLTGLLTWNFFANSISYGGQALLINQSLVNKVYSARQIYPLGGVLLACIDTAVSFIAFLGACLITRFVPAATTYWAPVLLLVAVLFATAVVLLVSVLVVYVRDLRNIVPFILQLGLFATPVIYNLQQVASGGYRLAYCFVNPLAPVIDNLRRTVLFGQQPNFVDLGAGALTSVVLFVVANWVFARFERGIADIV